MTDRQNEIITAAITLISEKGIQGLTIKNLAKAIKVSEPALYRHFDNKTAILLAILDSFKTLMPDVLDIINMESKSSIEKIHTIYNGYFKKFSETPELVAVIFSDEIFKNEKELSDKIAHLIQKNEDMFCQIIKAGQKSGEIRTDINSKHIAIVIMGSLRLIVKKWELSAYSFDLKKEGDKLFKSVILMISK
ncbi:hypothetical protein MNBD_IGNAVI01-691 [hydrothermal vent metagenome]|uniref:HTH tetR-type domain-containing protein n=1 Tax=hydrothermal vent metagenome TaxID=652676 RepID=A0A3B1CG00_9ZZZZ